MKASLYFLDTMSDNIVSDIHVCVGGEEEKEFMSVTTEKEQDGVTKMSWITKVNIIELEKRSIDHDCIVVLKETLLIGRFYTPYILQLWLTHSETAGRFHYKVHVSVIKTNSLMEDEENQESSSTMREYVGCICSIWIKVNQRERISFNSTYDVCEVWATNMDFSYILDQPQETYRFKFQLWFKLTDQSSVLHTEKIKGISLLRS